jgi:hypothetical protein
MLLPVGKSASDAPNLEGSGSPPRLSPEAEQAIIARADALLTGSLAYFSTHKMQVGSPPDWFFDPFRSSRIEHSGHWSSFDDFADGDIKVIWEPSRFEWMPRLAQAWILSGKDKYLAALNGWLKDWIEGNPPNVGPNWKCGQETSIRLLNILLTTRLLGTHGRAPAGLVDLVALHCKRIRATLRYAVSQNNNHGTSEAAALFVGGAWLAHQKGSSSVPARSRGWRDAGRTWLEDRVSKLVEADGSFAQYSVNYHRVFVDTMNQVESWRRELEEEPFSGGFSSRCRDAVEWLRVMTDDHSGDAPNIGANDGARLYDLSTTPYRDHRPSVQLGSLLFKGERVFESDTSDEPLSWLGLPVPAMAPAAKESRVFPDGGYVTIRKGAAWGVLRAPNFRFRPGHADALHLDLWSRGENILRDGGTYSYNTEPRWLDYFSGTESHNTVQFDGRDQMPRLGRFLYGAWLGTDEMGGLVDENGSIRWSGSYTDHAGCHHRRTVEATDRVWTVTDEFHGFRERAVLRWRLIPDEWSLEGQACSGARARVSVATEGTVRRFEVTKGWESRHYLERTELPVLEIEAGPGASKFTTSIELRG